MLVAACSVPGPVFVCQAGFETARINEPGNRFPEFQTALPAISDRVIDLSRVAQRPDYHPSQQGSRSIKNLLPAMALDLRHNATEGVQAGDIAMAAFLATIATRTRPERKQKMVPRLVRYGGLDT